MISKEELSKLLTTKLGKSTTVTEITTAGSGFHSDGYKVTTDNGECYFLKKVKSEDMGYEFPERKLMSLLVSHSMLKRHDHFPNSVGVAIVNENNGAEMLPDITEDTEVYQIQEYGGEGKSYADMLDQKTGKTHVDEEDKREIDQVVEFIANVHKVKPKTDSEKKLNAIYNDYLRSVIGHPEYLLLLLQRVPDDSPVLKPKEQHMLLSLMLENMHYFKNRSERLSAIHGDFWGANTFFREDGSMFAIDYSRMPWGDPGFDIGIWMSQYMIKYHITKSDYFKELGNYFLEQYIKKTGDSGVVNTMAYGIGVVSVIYSHPKSTPGIEDSARHSFYNHTINMLKRHEFYWEDDHHI